MTLSSITPLITYIATDGQTDFPLPNQYYDAADARAWLVNAAGEIPFTNPAGFTVIQTGTEAIQPGLKTGLVRLTTPRSDGDMIVVGVWPAANQDQKYHGIPITARQRERVVDRGAMGDAMLRELVGRAYRAPLSDELGSGVGRVIGPALEDHVPKWDENGNLVPGPSVADIEAAAGVEAGRALVYPEAPADPVYDAGGRRIGDVAEGVDPDDAVTLGQVGDLIDALADDLLAETVRFYDSTAEFKAAIIPLLDNAAYVDASNARHDVFAIGVPSVVKPWHVQADNGRYWEQRFPDGKIDVKRLGAVGGLSAIPPNDTAALAAAFDYANRAWWTGGGANVEARLRGSIWMPPGIYGVDPATPLELFDYIRLEGAGRGSTMIKPMSTAAGALLKHTFIPAGPNTRCTHIDIEGIRFIGSGAQTLVDARHCGRGTIRNCEFTTQDHYDQYFNTKQAVVAGLRGLEIATHDSVFIGGDVFTVQNCYFYFMDRALEGGRGTNQRTPEAVTVDTCEFSDNNLPIIFGGSYGGALGRIGNSVFQRWGPAGATGTARAIDTTGRRTMIEPGNYFETVGNTAAPILFRTGSERCYIDTRQHINYTATATGAFNPAELVSDNGTGSIII
jgi:hypothetical protein